MNLEFRGFEIKELGDGDDGTFSGYASTWDKDLYDDVIVKGAFADTLATDYPNGGAGIPLHWQHKDGSPFDVIGETLSAVEDDTGLLITGRLDLDIPEGKRVYDLMKRGLIHQMSIGFLAEETAWVQESDDKPWDGHREIRKIKLFEISMVQMAANQGCEVLEVKSGRAISRANAEKLRAAYDALDELLKLAEDAADEKPDEEDDDRKLAPDWAREYKEISDFFSLDNH